MGPLSRPPTAAELYPDCWEHAERYLAIVDEPFDDFEQETWARFFDAWSDGLFLPIEQCCDEDGTLVDAARRAQRLASFAPSLTFALEVFIAEQERSGSTAWLVRTICWAVRLERGERSWPCRDEEPRSEPPHAGGKGTPVRLPAATRLRFLMQR